jgi:hypothetical protein
MWCLRDGFLPYLATSAARPRIMEHAKQVREKCHPHACDGKDDVARSESEEEVDRMPLRGRRHRRLMSFWLKVGYVSTTVLCLAHICQLLFCR